MLKESSIFQGISGETTENKDEKEWEVERENTDCGYQVKESGVGHDSMMTETSDL